MNNWPFSDLPAGHYGTIYADPPWQFKAWSALGLGRAPDVHYSTQAPASMAHMNVASVAAPDCVLLM